MGKRGWRNITIITTNVGGGVIGITIIITIATITIITTTIIEAWNQSQATRHCVRAA